MAIKVQIGTYRDNPAATFWNRLGDVSFYTAPLIGFCVLFAGLPIADKYNLGTLFWIAWVALSIIAAIAFLILAVGICGIMERKAVEKKQLAQISRNYPGYMQVPKGNMYPRYPETDNEKTMNLSGIVEEIRKMD